MIALQRRQVVAHRAAGDAAVVAAVEVRRLVTCEQPASFQNRVSIAQSASVPEPIETQTSIPTAAGSRPACSVRVRSWPNTSSALAAG